MKPYNVTNAVWKNLEKWYANDPMFLDLILCMESESDIDISTYDIKDRQKVLANRYKNREDFSRHFVNVINQGWRIDEMAYPNIAVSFSDVDYYDPDDCDISLTINFNVAFNRQLSPNRDGCLNCRYNGEEMKGRLTEAILRPFDYITTVNGDKCATNLFSELKCMETIHNKGCDNEYWEPWVWNVDAEIDHTESIQENDINIRDSELIEFNLNVPIKIYGIYSACICRPFIGDNCKLPNTCYLCQSPYHLDKDKVCITCNC